MFMKNSHFSHSIMGKNVLVYKCQMYVTSEFIISQFISGVPRTVMDNFP